MNPARQSIIRSLFKDYIKRYAARDDGLTEQFSDDFSGYTGGGDFIVGDASEWIAITRRDFAQVPGHIRIEMLDLLTQNLCDDVVVATALFHIHLPIPEQTLSREAVRLTLVFRLENDRWKIVHSGISVPYYLVQKDEVYPIKGLYERNHELELLLKERTLALEEATRTLDIVHRISHQVRQHLETRLGENPNIQGVADALCYSRRTLARRLKVEGSSFFLIKDRLRRSVALTLLITDKLPAETVSLRIGFADLSTFHRAFKKWTGVTPQAYSQTRG